MNWKKDAQESPLEGTVEEILPSIRCGFYYPDKWISPYLGVDFAVPAGRPVLEFTVYNPNYEAFDGASFLVRLGLVPLYRSGLMRPDTSQRRAIELPAFEEMATIAISFRSSVRWRPPNHDKRVLGLILSSLHCSVVVPTVAGKGEG